MSENFASGQSAPVFTNASQRVPPHARSPWQLWRSLRSDILRHLHECDRLGVSITVEKLAEELDEALGLVERRAQELQNLQLVCLHADRRIELQTGSRRKCG